MNGIHDMGGMQCMGPIVREENEPQFHEEWEGRVFGMFFTNFAEGHFNVDMFRHAIERMGPAEYLETSYYEHWLHVYETVLVERGILTQAELEEKLASLREAGGS